MECGPYGDPKKANLLVVGPITDEAKKATGISMYSFSYFNVCVFVLVNLTLSRMYSSEFIHPNAWLLTVRPLQIAHKNVTKLFLTYSPPKKYVYVHFHGFFLINSSLIQYLPQHGTTTAG